MGERKVVQKYIPPDFDPTKVPRSKREANGRIEIRMMLPFNCQCLVCGEFMYRGTKFNSKKEDVIGPNGNYLGQKIFRFVMKCMGCNSLFSILTDPENADYKAERGISRNFEPWRDGKKQTEDDKKAREEEEKYDAMRALENRTEDSRRQMEMLDALEELKDQKARLNTSHIDMTTEALLAVRDLNKKKIEEKKESVDIHLLNQEDEELVRKMFTKKTGKSDTLQDIDNVDKIEIDSSLADWGGGGKEEELQPSNVSTAAPIIIKRIRDEDLKATRSLPSASLLSYKSGDISSSTLNKPIGLQALVSVRPKALERIPDKQSAPASLSNLTNIQDTHVSLIPESKRIKLVDYDDDEEEE
jgi:hypothetical protein